MKFSIVVLTFNRPTDLKATVQNLYPLVNRDCEMIVVDNASEIHAVTVLEEFDRVKVIRELENKGVAARNSGILSARGDIVICLDDDVYGLDVQELRRLDSIFSTSVDVGAICFQVRNATTGKIMNWIHHRNRDVFATKEFETYEITEGAVAFRASALRETRLYPEEFFISHEGPDLAYQLMDASFKVIYTPSVVVKHAHSSVSRESWRRYYFDTRNVFWLVARNLPLSMGLPLIIRQVGGMFMFAIRDGYLRWWCKGVFDGLAGLNAAAANRNVISENTIQNIRKIRRQEESLRERWARFRRGQVVSR